MSRVRSFVYLVVALSCGLAGCSGSSFCTLTDGTCPSSCEPIQARPVMFNGGEACWADFEVLGCRGKKESVSEVDACIVSEDGDTLYLTNGTDANKLISEQGYTACTAEQEEKKSQATAACE